MALSQAEYWVCKPHPTQITGGSDQDIYRMCSRSYPTFEEAAEEAKRQAASGVRLSELRIRDSHGCLRLIDGNSSPNRTP